MNYRVVRITKNVEKYPEYKEDTEEFPDLVEYVDDECDIFVVSEEDDDFYPADQFFYMVNVKNFSVDT